MRAPIPQYVAPACPVVANPVGVHREMIVHGETGFLAETPDEWIEAVGASNTIATCVDAWPGGRRH